MKSGERSPARKPTETNYQSVKNTDLAESVGEIGVPFNAARRRNSLGIQNDFLFDGYAQLRLLIGKRRAVFQDRLHLVALECIL